jgi:hypothetical protein
MPVNSSTGEINNFNLIDKDGVFTIRYDKDYSAITTGEETTSYTCIFYHGYTGTEWGGRVSQVSIALVEDGTDLYNALIDLGAELIECQTINGRHRVKSIPETIDGECYFRFIIVSTSRESARIWYPLFNVSINNNYYEYFTVHKNGTYGYNKAFQGGDNYSFTLSGKIASVLYNENTIREANLQIGDIIDFGEAPQPILPAWYNFIIEHTEPVYNGKITVKNFEGDTTLAEMTEIPRIIEVSCSAIGNIIDFSVKGENQATYTRTWSSSPPVDTTFLGLALAPKSNKPTIAVGEISSVSWDGDIVLYESYGKYTPPTTVFDINTYKNSSEVNRVDKSNYLVSAGTLSGVLRDECSILTPSIVFQSPRVPTFNYVYIPIFKRYYFVTGLSSVGKNLWRMELNCDVLMTYQENIYLLRGVVGRQENAYNPLLIDPDIPTQNDPIIEIIDIPSNAFDVQSTESGYNYILTVIGA